MIPGFKKLKERHQFFFAILIGIAVILFWRGVWAVADVLIFPDDYLLSGIISLLLGLFILITSKYLIRELI